MLSHFVTYYTCVQSFHYKILSDVLFLEKRLNTFGIKPSPMFPFCNLYDEAPLYIFYECDTAKRLWAD